MGVTSSTMFNIVLNVTSSVTFNVASSFQVSKVEYFSLFFSFFEKNDDFRFEGNLLHVKDNKGFLK